MAETKPDNLRETEKTLGQVIIEARKRRGLSPEEVVRETRIPAHYVKMIESDTAALISDQLYLLPFLRRYASFLGLDAEEIASRFVHDVQRSETSVTRMSEPIHVVEKNRGGGHWFRVFIILILAACAVLAAYLVVTNYDEVKRMVMPAVSQPKQAQPAAVSPPPIVSEPPAQAPPPEGVASPAAPEPPPQ